jgi:hypothetical protein
VEGFEITLSSQVVHSSLLPDGRSLHALRAPKVRLGVVVALTWVSHLRRQDGCPSSLAQASSSRSSSSTRAGHRFGTRAGSVFGRAVFTSTQASTRFRDQLAQTCMSWHNTVAQHTGADVRGQVGRNPPSMRLFEFDVDDDAGGGPRESHAEQYASIVASFLKESATGRESGSCRPTPPRLKKYGSNRSVNKRSTPRGLSARPNDVPRIAAPQRARARPLSRPATRQSNPC